MVQLLNHSFHSQETVEYLLYARYCPNHEDTRVNKTDRSLNFNTFEHLECVRHYANAKT